LSRNLQRIKSLEKNYHSAQNRLVKVPKSHKKGERLRKRLDTQVACKELKSAKRKFQGQIEHEAKRTCRPLCEKMHEKLPRELRDMVYKDLIIDNNNATLYCGEDSAAAYKNGQSALYHCFDLAYTGSGMHKDMIQELCRRGVRFDFRGRHDMLSKAIQQYNSELGLDFADIVKSVGITISENCLKYREKMLERLKALFKFSKGSTIHVFVEAEGKTQCQMVHSFRRILRATFSLLERLKTAGYVLKVVLNPARNPSAAEDSSNSTFTIIPEQKFRYLFQADNVEFSVAGFEKKLKQVCCKGLTITRLS
jgi:hypothetical protein